MPEMRGRPAATGAIGFVFFIVALAVAHPAWARKNGVEARGCDGCHQGGKAPTVKLTASSMQPAVGEAITLTVTVSQTNGPVAGFFLTTAFGSGTFKAIEAGTNAGSNGVTHTMPRTGSGGVTQFQAQWTTTKATGVEFDVYALSANGDGTTGGDGAGTAILPVVVGCGAGHTYYLDQDADGYGTTDSSYPARQDCALPMGYAATGGDCDDFHATIHPGAPELCDGKDNDCNDAVDDSVVSQVYCEDKDGDGHGVVGHATKMDCAPSLGFGDCKGDCDDLSAAIYPGAPEVCNGYDDNCNVTADEGVRPTCGVGACLRSAASCTAACVPGQPMVETCNALDDDCDGVIDNGTDVELCGTTGRTCVQGRCTGGTSDGGSGGVTGSGGTTSSGGSGGADAGADSAPDTGPDASGAGSGGSTGGSHGAQSTGCAIGKAAGDTSESPPGFLLVAVGLWLRTRRRRPATRFFPEARSARSEVPN